MIPSSFDYHRPATLGDVATILRDHGDTARVMAGGHSLIPLMKLRMTAIDHLIDLQDIAELRGVTLEGDAIVLGAMTTQHDLIENALLRQHMPILREAALQIADPQVRYMGTVGGNVANGDPGNDMPGLMQCLDASFRLVGPDGARDVPARAYYLSAYETTRADDEVLAQIRIPTLAAGTGYAYEKQKRKIGDYATAAAAVLLRREGGVCTSASIAMTNLGDTPRFAADAATALTGTPLDEAALCAAVDAMQTVIDPNRDNRGPIDFKRHVAGTILRRAIARAASRAA